MKDVAKRFLPPPRMVPFALLSSLLLALAFPPFSLGTLSFVALVPVFFSWSTRKARPGDSFRTGYLFGLAFFFLLLWWVKDLAPWSSITIPWLMVPALALLVLYLALFPALFFYLASRLWRSSPGHALVGAPALWTLVEIVRSKGELGFPWGVAGYALSYHPYLIQLASLGGVFSISFVVLAVNVLLTGALISNRWRSRIGLLLGGVLLVAGNGMGGKAVIDRGMGLEAGDTLTVAVVQPNIDLRIKWDPAFTDSIFSHMENMCRRVSRFRPDLYIFPETSAPVYLRYEPVYKGRLSRLAAELESPIFIGFLDARRKSEGGEALVFNSSGMFSKEGTLFAQYDKIHLLPFGEALPLSSRLRFLRRIDFGQANFEPGRPGEPLRFDSGSIGPLICFESIFTELARRHVARGADYLVNITNDGWFGRTPGPVQHAQMAIIRAVENRRYLLRSANSGISMVVDPWGRVTQSLALDREGVIVQAVAPIRELTLYTAHGESVVVLPSLALVLGTFLLSRAQRSRRART